MTHRITQRNTPTHARLPISLGCQYRQQGFVITCNTRGSNPGKVMTATYSAIRDAKSTEANAAQVVNLQSIKSQAEQANNEA